MHRLNTTSEGEMLVDEAELPITRSQYCVALDALRAAPAHYLKEVGDQWMLGDLFSGWAWIRTALKHLCCDRSAGAGFALNTPSG